MDKRTVNILSYAVILLISGWIFYLTSQLQLMNSKILPQVINTFMAGLAVLGIIRELCRKKTEQAKPARSRSTTMFLWLLPLVGLAIGCRLLGFYLAPFLFVALYVRLNGGSLKETILCSLCAPAFIYLLFNVLLKLDLEQGLLWNLIQGA